MRKLLLYISILITSLLFSCKEPVYAQAIDSTNYKMYIADRDRFLEQQETVKSKNTYLQLQGAITLLNMYITNEEKRFKLNLERK